MHGEFDLIFKESIQLVTSSYAYYEIFKNNIPGICIKNADLKNLDPIIQILKNNFKSIKSIIIEKKIILKEIVECFPQNLEKISFVCSLSKMIN